MFCLDASVILSAARGSEINSGRSRAFLEFIRREEAKVFLPEIVIPEIASGLVRATKSGVFGDKFVTALRAIPNFSFVPVDSSISNLAVQVIQKTALRSADAIYVALALDYGLTLVTLDKEQLNKGKKLIAVREP